MFFTSIQSLNKIKHILFFGYAFLFLNQYSSFSQSNNICSSAMDISPNFIYYNDSIEAKLDTTNLNSLHLFHKKNNTLWFRFQIPHASDLTFDIIPVSPVNDYDFILYKKTNDKFCDSIIHQKAIRTNLSRTDMFLKGQTGLSFDAEKDSIPTGPGEAYSKYVSVSKDGVYYLMIHNFSKKPGKFLLNIYLKKITEDKTTLIEDSTSNSIDNKLSKTKLNITILDYETNVPVKASIDIERATGKSIKIKNKTQQVVELNNSEKITINCNAKGYLLFSQPFVSPNQPENISFDIKLKKIKEGESINLTQIKFEPDNAVFLRSSESSLKSLLKFLQDNPTVKIEIQGHVNGPNSKNTSAFKKLSKRRAEAVNNYLISKGINKSRLSYIGMGNTQMIYPKPDRETQREENRRVEIEIISTK